MPAPSRPAAYRSPPFDARLPGVFARFPLPGYSATASGSSAPLTYSQEEMWYQYLLDPSDPIYNEYDAILIDGPLDEGALADAMRAVAARHDVFRVRFADGNGEPAMTFEDAPSFPLEIVDARGRARDNETAFVHDWVRRIVRPPFDLRAASPARATLVRLGDERRLFTIVMHHIVKDGTSEGTMMRDLSHFYAHAQGRFSAALPPLETTLAGFARWQRTLRDAGVFDANVRWWVDELTGIAPAEVPGDAPRPALLSTAGAKAYRNISSDLVAALRSLAREEGATLYMALSAVLAALLHRYSGAAEVPIAFPVHNRLSATEAMLGCFMNSLVFRARLDGATTFRDVLRRTLETMNAAYEHQDVSLAQAVGAISTARRADQTAIAAAACMMRSPKWAKLDLPGCRTTRFDVDVGISKLDLVFEFEEFQEHLLAKLEYRTSLYTAQTMRALLENFEALLTFGARYPDAPFRCGDALAAADRTALRRAGAGPRTDVSDTVLHQIEHAAASRPGAVAVVGTSEPVHYGRLWRRAARVAEALRSHVPPGSMVGLCAERGPAAVAAVLGILQARCAYVPLDPALPADRLRHLADDANIALAVVQRATGFSDVWPGAVCVLDDLLDDPDSPPDAADARRERRDDMPHSADAAYVMYTSGSAGSPNGVLVEHRALANYIGAFAAACALAPSDRVVQFGALGFDISLEEIFGTLVSGATLLVPPPNIAHSVDALLQWCERERATVLDFPTAYFHEVARTLDETAAAFPSAVRLVVVGGEPLRRDAAETFLSQTGNRVRLLNTYGPTETTVAVSMHEVTAADLAHEGPVPVGRPIPNVELHVLDAGLEPLPRGALGTVYVGGMALARGYLNRDVLTERRFVAHPRLGRLYCTGDRGRIRLDGCLEIRGRVDDQVKIRGFRVEPAEIEAAFRAEPEVRDAAVVVDGGEIALGLVCESGDLEAIRARVARRLPDYMLPARIARLESIPLTANGKSDRRAIAAAARQAAASGSDSDEGAPHAALVRPTTTQARIAAVWEEFFGRRVGLNEDFFKLGGHSLMAARMFARIERKLGRRLPLAQLFLRPTIAGLAEAITDEALHASSFIAMHESARRGRPVFYLHGDYSGGALYTRALAKALRIDRPFCVLAPHGGAGEPMPPSIEAMADDYVRIIKGVQPHGPYTLGGHCISGLIALETGRRLQQGGDEVDLVFAVQPPPVHYFFAPLISALHAAAGLVRVPAAARLRLATALKRAWRLLDRAADPRRRAQTVRELRGKMRRRVRGEGRPAEESAWRSSFVGEQIRLADRFNPKRFEGRLVVVRTRDSVHDLIETAGWRRAAREVRIVETPGDQSSAFTKHQAALADVLSRALGEAGVDDLTLAEFDQDVAGALGMKKGPADAVGAPFRLLVDQPEPRVL